MGRVQGAKLAARDALEGAGMVCRLSHCGGSKVVPTKLASAVSLLEGPAALEHLFRYQNWKFSGT